MNKFKVFAMVVARFFTRTNIRNIWSSLLGLGARKTCVCHRNRGLLIGSTTYGALTPPSTPHHSPRPLFIFILGAPGVGKGTVSSFLKTAVPGLTHLSYGDLIRYQDQIPGSWISSFPRRGGSNNLLLPACDAVRLLRETIEAGAEQYGQLIWPIDGFPRTEQHVSEWMAQMPRADCILYLSCPPDISFERILARAATSGRADDADPETVRERIERNNAESNAMFDNLRKWGMEAVCVNTDRDLKIVEEEILNHVQVSI